MLSRARARPPTGPVFTLLGCSSATVAQAVVAAYNLAAAGPLVDVGGGQGQLLAAILRANPTLLGTLFDLPSVVYLLSRVFNSFDDERAAAVLASCRRAMGEGRAKLLLAERVLPERVEPTPAIQSRLLADLNMLVRTGGRDRSEAEFREMLAAAGLRLERVVPTAGPVSLVEAALQ